ncbi:MAG: hypothetical protein MUC28_04410 [Planctomycetes bacterium]|jgi:hypothetical protein|nr:hypothetical protein [Planctomycetota bacterium]
MEASGDIQYLENRADQQAAAGELRRARREDGGAGAEDNTAGSEGNSAGENRDISGELRRDRQAAKAEKEQEKGKEKTEQAGQPLMAQAGTNRALRWAWGSLLMTWGVSLLYIDIHAFLHLVLGKRFFCQLGHEWLPKQMAKGVQGKIMNFFLWLAEIILFVLANGLALLVVVIACFVVYLIVDIILHPTSSLLWNFGFKAIYSMVRVILGF